jgi:TonB family protein
MNGRLILLSEDREILLIKEAGDAIESYSPTVTTPENSAALERAISDYKLNLLRNPNDLKSITGLGYLYSANGQTEDAKAYYRKATEVDREGPLPYCALGAIDWAETNKRATEIKAKAALNVDDDITGNKGICHEVQQANQQHVTDGIEAVNNALKLWPDDRDAAALMSLLYRRKADIGCGDANRRAEDLRAADELVKRNGESLKANPGKLGCMSFLRPLPFGDRQHGLNSAAKAPQRIFLKTNVMPRNSLIKKVDPRYPTVARQAHIQGTVVLRVEIGTDGAIQSLSAISGHPELVHAAIEAVRQWRYQPFMLNGAAAEVETEITVNFSLSNSFFRGTTEIINRR